MVDHPLEQGELMFHHDGVFTMGDSDGVGKFSGTDAASVV
jgi:hypothetical protein